MENRDIYELEKLMWNAAKNRDKESFLTVVSEEAVMVCGGYRCTGKEYAEIIAEFDCKAYEIDHFEIVNEDCNSTQVHYVIDLTVEDLRNSDFAGKFHVTTTWNKKEDKWKVVFNMDQKIVGD